MKRVAIAEAKAAVFSASGTRRGPGGNNDRAAKQAGGSAGAGPRTRRATVDVFRAAWTLGGLDMPRIVELPLDDVDLDR